MTRKRNVRLNARNWDLLAADEAEFRNFEKVRHITHEIDELDAQRKVARSRQHFHRHRPF